MTIDILELTTTTETQLQAQTIAGSLIDNRLAACVQITGPIESVYRWQGEICHNQEFRLTIKSTPKLAQKLIDFVVSIHPYDTPEILFNRLEASDAYGKWLLEQTSDNV